MPHRRKKSHTLRNALIAIIVLIVVVSAIVVARQMSSNGPAAGPPTFSAVSSSSTITGTSCAFSALWKGDGNISGYIFETNNTGVFVNDTWMPFSNFMSQNSAYSKVTKGLTGTIGDVVSWRFWANDTSNRWTVIPLQSFFIDTNKVLLVTSMGNITIMLYPNMPITTGNFKKLVREGAYDGTTFHRVVPGFVIQGGDVSSKGITVPPIPDELPNKYTNTRGTVAMAKTSQPNSATSQFFINLNDSNAGPPASLDKSYAVFGTVLYPGMDVVDKISLVPVYSTTQGEPGFQEAVNPVTIITAQFIK